MGTAALLILWTSPWPSSTMRLHSTFDAKESRRRAWQGKPSRGTIFHGQSSSGCGWSSPSAWPWVRPSPPLPPNCPANAPPSPPPRLRWSWWRRPHKNPNPFSPSARALSPFPQAASSLPAPGRRPRALFGRMILRFFRPPPGSRRLSPALLPAHNSKFVGRFARTHQRMKAPWCL